MKTKIFHDKVFLITGASSGIGEALALSLSMLHAKMILTSRNEETLDKVKRACSGDKRNIHILRLDLTCADEIATKVNEAWNRWGRIDYVIHNAGIAARDFAVNTSAGVNRSVMETNFFGPVAVTRAVLSHMLPLGKGHIVAIGSLAGEFGLPVLSSYSASKHAVRGFFESLRTEVKRQGIKISIISPGFINTSIIRNAVDGDGNLIGRNLAVNEQGMSAEACAKKILKAIAAQKEKAFIGGTEICSVYLHRIWPSLFSKILVSHPIKRLRFFRAGVRNLFSFSKH